MLNTLLTELEELGFALENDVGTPTYRSHGCFSTLDGPGIGRASWT